MSLPAGWTLTNAGNKGWENIASSSDGSKLVAVVSNGDIYRSTDSGATWTSTGDSNLNTLEWTSVASSSDGTNVIAVFSGYTNGNIYSSTNSGVTWTPIGPSVPIGKFWTSVACSSDGTKIVAVIRGKDIYRSTDSGYTWTGTGDSNLNTLGWLSVASSSDGTILVAGIVSSYPSPPGEIYRSTDSGVTWTPTGNSSLNKSWGDIAISSDGQMQFAVSQNMGDIYRSTDFGATWSATGYSGFSNRMWSSVAISSDGSKIVAVSKNYMGMSQGEVFISTNYGVTWTPSGYSGFNINWKSVAMSSDGSKIVAAVQYGGVYTYNSAAVCFLEGTKILSLVDGQETYIPIEQIRKGTLIKTHLHGYKPVDIIATSKIFNSGDNNRIKDRLYKYSKETNSDLFEDLIVTGGHSSLVDELSESQKEATREFWDVLQKTDDKYRLLACVDKNTIPYKEEGTFNIYHIALEHEDETANYGIYSNGLLVESCSKLHLMNEITMKSIE